MAGVITNDGFLECIILYNALCTMHAGETIHCKPCYKLVPTYTLCSSKDRLHLLLAINGLLKFTCMPHVVEKIIYIQAHGRCWSSEPCRRIQYTCSHSVWSDIYTFSHTVPVYIYTNSTPQIPIAMDTPPFILSKSAVSANIWQFRNKRTNFKYFAQ